jgi:hypothetical protein
LRRGVGILICALVVCAQVVVGVQSAAAANGTLSDPTNDNGPDFNAHGDITSISVAYTTELTLTTSVRTYENPLTSGAWKNFGSGPAWAIDTTGDQNPEYIGGIYNDGLGNVFGELDTLDTFEFACETVPFWSATTKSYSMRIPQWCIGGPPSVSVTAAFFFTNATSDSFDDTDWTAPIAADLLIPPNAPTNVHAVAGDRQATVSWDPATTDGTRATGYEISELGGSVIGSVDAATTSFVVTGLTNGQTYRFTVVANSAAGPGGVGVTNLVTPSPPPPTVPGAPVALEATRGDRSVVLDWEPPASDGGSPIIYYDIQTTPAHAHAQQTAPPVTSVRVSGLANGVTYEFTVVAHNVKGAGPSATVSATPDAVPFAPNGVVATPGDHTVSVSWNAAGGFGTPVTGYSVVAEPGGLTNTVDGSTTSAVFSGLTNGTSYVFTVSATNAAGDGPASAPVTGKPSAPASVPSAPRNVHATGGQGKATVTWTPPLSNGGSAITGYEVTANPGGVKVAAGPGATSATLSVAPGSYAFEVVAKNDIGPSPAATSGSIVVAQTTTARAGYWMLDSAGHVYPFGQAPNLASALLPQTTAVAISARADGGGYWVAGRDGSVRAFGTAKFKGDHPSLPTGEFVSTISGTPSGNGYWLFTNRGRAIAYGDAQHFGDMSRAALNGPIVASIATPSGHGYYMVGSDGGIFSFGDAGFHGSMGGARLNKPVVGISPTPDNKGYWLVASDGGVFAFNAPFRGSMGATRLNRPVNGLVAFGNGYLMVASDGGVFNFSNRPFFGSLASSPPPAPIVGIAAFSS